MDTHTLDRATIREKHQTTEYLLQAVSAGTRFKVILCVPMLEAIFFMVPEILERIFPKVQFSTYSMFFSKQPKEALAFLFAQGGGPTTLPQLLNALTEEDAERLRAAGPL